MALAIYLASRAVVLAAIWFAANFVPRNQLRGAWDATASWYGYLLRWDSGWYLSIARNGYHYTGSVKTQESVVFFPFYPLLGRAIANVLGIELGAAFILVANVLAIAAIIVIFKVLRDAYSDKHALPAIAFVSFFPSSLFFSAGYSESLMLFLIGCFFVFLAKRYFVVAASFAGAASGARYLGPMLVAPLLWDLWDTYRLRPPRFVVMATLCGGLATTGLLLFMLYLWRAFGDPFAFIHARAAFEGSRSALINIAIALSLFPFWRLANVFIDGPAIDRLEPWFCLLFLAALAWGWRRLTIQHFIYSFFVVVITYLYRAATLNNFDAMPRYLLMAFPVFALFAMLTDGRPRLRYVLLAISATMLFVYMAMFAQWYDVI